MRNTYSNVHVVRHGVRNAKVGQERLGNGRVAVSWDDVSSGERWCRAGVLGDSIDDHELRVSLGELAEVLQDLASVLVGPVVEDVAEHVCISGPWQLGLALQVVLLCWTVSGV